MKPETRVIGRVRDAVVKQDPSISFDKTNNPYAKGILDLYVEAHRFAGHIEAKFRPTKYKAGDVIDTDVIVAMCSEHQHKRFKRHVLNHIPALLLCGFNGPNQRNRTYCLIKPIGDDDIIWPSRVTVLDIDQTVRLILKWVNTYEIQFKVD